MCAGEMVIRESVAIVRVPGNAKHTERPTREWVCPDCDYFEDAEDER
jgi:hypothetical protein